ncbi:serine--tRNA ligase [Cuniculiplasma sp. SKW3]|uniref:serine--tRNA ligase n=1 Tax=Cuniculiplasma sp. SKW3 TaxID=3400170 RepID=UPI003FD29862
MIDIKLLRDDPSIYRKAMIDRFLDPSPVEEFLKLDQEWRENIKKINELRSIRNARSLEVSKAVKEKRDAEEIKREVKEINASLGKLEERQREVEEKRDKMVNLIPNVLDREVPICKGDENNLVVRVNGEAKVREDSLETFLKESNNLGKYKIVKETYSHVDIIEKYNLVDLERATKIAGARFYISKNRLLKLELALINYAIDFLSQKGFSVVEPPPMIAGNAVWKATDQGTFDDAIYKIEGEDLYLISTSEHPIASMLMDEIVEPKELPMKVGGFSPCFRKEAGAHGKDTKGIFRVHYFKKVEQFIFCKPEDSWDFFDELTKNTEEFLQSLGIPYRVVNVCSGELGNLAAKKFDIEGWFPHQGRYRELASISNDLDYQARSLNIRYRGPDGNIFVHTLNGTAMASSRTIVAIIENFSHKDHIKIPEALIPYTGFDSIYFEKD